MLPSAMSSSIVGALLIHSESRCEMTRHPSASCCSSDVADTIGYLIEGGVPIDLVHRRVEQRVLVARVVGNDLRGPDNPDQHALAATGVDVARVFNRHLSVDRVHAADMR